MAGWSVATVPVCRPMKTWVVPMSKRGSRRPIRLRGAERANPLTLSLPIARMPCRKRQGIAFFNCMAIQEEPFHAHYTRQ